MAFSFFAEMAICWKLWVPFGREFPMIPALKWLPVHLTVWVDCILCGIVIFGLALIIAGKHTRPALLIVLICFIVLILEDISRLQPWLYMQSFIMLACEFGKTGKGKQALTGILILVSTTYLWSGLQKLNPAFLNQTMPWILSGVGLEEYPHGTLKFKDYYLVAPIGEMLCGLLLLVRKSRKAGIVLGIGMHFFILIAMGPLGLNWNKVIWPWNFSLILLLFAFWNYKEPIGTNLKSFKINWLIILLFGVMPLFNFFGWWDDALSGTMYSGTHTEAGYYFHKKSEDHLPKFRDFDTTPRINWNGEEPEYSTTWFVYWSINDLEAPYYPAERYLTQIALNLCKQANRPDKAGLEVNRTAKFTATETQIVCTCNDLMD